MRLIGSGLASFFAAGIWVSLALAVATHEVVLSFDLQLVSSAVLDGPLPLFLLVFVLADIFLDTAFIGSRNSLLRRRPGFGVSAVVLLLIVYSGTLFTYHSVQGTFGDEVAVNGDWSLQAVSKNCMTVVLVVLLSLRTLSYMRVRDEVPI